MSENLSEDAAEYIVWHKAKMSAQKEQSDAEKKIHIAEEKMAEIRARVRVALAHQKVFGPEFYSLGNKALVISKTPTLNFVVNELTVLKNTDDAEIADRTRKISLEST